VLLPSDLELESVGELFFLDGGEKQCGENRIKEYINFCLDYFYLNVLVD